MSSHTWFENMFHRCQHLALQCSSFPSTLGHWTGQLRYEMFETGVLDRHVNPCQSIHKYSHHIIHVCSCTSKIRNCLKNIKKKNINIYKQNTGLVDVDAWHLPWGCALMTPAFGIFVGFLGFNSLWTDVALLWCSCSHTPFLRVLTVRRHSVFWLLAERATAQLTLWMQLWHALHLLGAF